jgi:YgiT-type zinc finger domain-containing protein
MKCDMCGKAGARVRRVTRSVGTGRSEFFIEGVPLITCPSCGESYLTADTLKEIERIRANWRKLTVEKKVRMARFGRAA